MTTETAEAAAPAGRPDRDEDWKPVPGFSAYEASDNSAWEPGDDGKPVQVSGGIRSVDRTAGSRRYKGQILKARVLANTGGYLGTNMTDDQGVKRTVLVHRVILLAHDKPCPEGMETRHSERGPLWNRFPEDICWGTHLENEADKPVPSAPPEPAFECINHPRCGGMAFNPGRRCLECVADVGREAADMLRARVPLQEVAEHFGYTGLDWVYSLAVKHGGFDGTKTEARTQVRRPPHQPCICEDCAAPLSRRVIRRVAITLRIRRASQRGGDRA